MHRIISKKMFEENSKRINLQLNNIINKDKIRIKRNDKCVLE